MLCTLWIYMISSDKMNRKQTPCKLLNAVKETLTQETPELRSSWRLGVHLERILPCLLLWQHFFFKSFSFTCCWLKTLPWHSVVILMLYIIMNVIFFHWVFLQLSCYLLNLVSFQTYAYASIKDCRNRVSDSTLISHRIYLLFPIKSRPRLNRCLDHSSHLLTCLSFLQQENFAN